jgi:predicted MFS family arabinose efflux permease
VVGERHHVQADPRGAARHLGGWGGILTTYAGCRYIFFFNVPIGVAALALAPKVVPESRARSGPRRYDAFGAVSITAACGLTALTAIPVAFVLIRRTGKS